MAKVLVTGGAGFIGSHVAEAFLARGDEVTILDNLSTGKRENLPKEAEFLEMDLRDSGLASLVAARGFDIVSHHAAQMDVRVSVNDPRYDASINIDGLLNLVEACVAASVGKFMFVSSGGTVYGDPALCPTPEDAPTLPESPYGVSKITGEQYLYYYHRVHGLDYVAMRYGNVFGPRQDPHGEAGVVAIFSTRLHQGQPLLVFGNGTQTRDYIYIDDVVSANLRLSEPNGLRAERVSDRAFNVGSGQETSVLELAKAIQETAGAFTGIEHRPMRPGELMRVGLDITKVLATGWKPTTEMSVGFKQTHQWIGAERVA